MIEQIVDFTILIITKRKILNPARRERDFKQTTVHEMETSFGLLILAGIQKAGNVNAKELWTKDGTGPIMFRACMSSNRCAFRLQCLRFDDKEPRGEKRKN